MDDWQKLIFTFALLKLAANLFLFISSIAFSQLGIAVYGQVDLLLCARTLI